jgi:hypothetical protein
MLMGWAVLLTPLTILVHELGHLAVAYLTGLPAELHPTAVSGGADYRNTSHPMMGLQAGAGPLVTIVMGLIAARLFARDRSRLWALAFAVAAVSRMVVTTGYLGVRLFKFVLGQPFTNNPNFDEHHVGTAAGIPPILVSAVASAFLFALLYWLLRRVPRGRRILFIIAVTVGIVAGSALWSLLMPPVLLSVPGR